MGAFQRISENNVQKSHFRRKHACAAENGMMWYGKQKGKPEQ